MRRRKRERRIKPPAGQQHHRADVPGSGTIAPPSKTNIAFNSPAASFATQDIGFTRAPNRYSRHCRLRKR